MSEDRKSATKNPDNYYWLLSESKFMYMPTRTLIEPAAVRGQIGDNAAKACVDTRTCSNLTWAPGWLTLVKDTAAIDGAWAEFPGNTLLNTYRATAPTIIGDAEQAGLWLELGERLWGDHLEHLLNWLAFKVQNPAAKINHCIVLGSREQGLGKDSWLAGTLPAIGRWNWKNVGASMALAYADKNFTASLLRKSILRISEVHDLKEARHRFYDLTKDWCARLPKRSRLPTKMLSRMTLRTL